MYLIKSISAVTNYNSSSCLFLNNLPEGTRSKLKNDYTVNCEIVLDRAGGSNGMHIGTEILNKSSHMSLK